jgi:LmbE family N-acetylglucosaminyl deacetylase
MINKDTSLLILSPHPDDETIGCGGLIQKVKKMGGKVFVQILTYGDEEQYGGFSEKSTRVQELNKVMKHLNVDDFEVLFPGDDYHLKMDRYPEKLFLDTIEKNSRLALNKINPTMVGLPNPHSYNVDHQMTWKAGFTALRPRPHHLKAFCPLVFTYDDLAPWAHAPFKGNWFVNISDELDSKIKAMELYASQIREEPHERSLENIRKYHEVLGRSQGVLAVEQFRLERLYSE